MKKFTEFIGGVREAEEAKKSELQKSYQDYFQAKLSKFGVESPADLDDEKKKEFFNDIAADWDAGKGVKASAEKKVEKEKEEAGVKEAEAPATEEGLNEASNPDIVVPANDADDLDEEAAYFQSMLKKAGVIANCKAAIGDVEVYLENKSDLKKAQKAIEKNGYTIEESEVNESMSFDEIKDKYIDNPYGIGAQAVEFVEGERGNPNRLIFRHDEKFRRDEIAKKLKAFGIPAKKMSTSTQDKAYKYRYELILQESEVNESINEPIFEGEISLSDQFALVLCGGSIGAKQSFPIFIGNIMGTVIETGNDKDYLIEEKKRRNKQLTPGEKSYYRMSYKVIELTNSKIKLINDLIAAQNKSDDTEVSESIKTVNELDSKAVEHKLVDDLVAVN